MGWGIGLNGMNGLGRVRSFATNVAVTLQMGKSSVKMACLDPNTMPKYLIFYFPDGYV